MSVTLVALGDSTAVGVGAWPGVGYPDHLASRAAQRGTLGGARQPGRMWPTIRALAPSGPPERGGRSAGLVVSSTSMAPPFLTSGLLPVPHGFSLREGGVSEGPYASLNLGFAVGDARERVEENFRRLAAAAGAELAALHTISQVHGDRVLEARRTPPEGGLRPPEGEADALFTASPGSWIGVKTADCVPVLLVDPDLRQVAAVHSGWRGTDAEVTVRAVEALVARGAKPGRLLAAIGPSIRACCYVVSAELARRFQARFGSGVVARSGDEVTLDLAGAIRTSLLRAGLDGGHIDTLEACTACDPRRYFSHRRDAGRTGRHLSFVIHGF